MRRLVVLAMSLFLVLNLFAQDEKIRELVDKGVELHDQGKYDDAIKKYKEALDLSKNSGIANYELSYTYMTLKRYEEAVNYSRISSQLESDARQGAFVVLGSSLDLMGKPIEAIKAYEDGLKIYPTSNLLNYNLALTCMDQKQYEKAESAAILAINARPTHASSHIILATLMKYKNQRIKAVLCLYYALMLEPNNKRSAAVYADLRALLDQGVKQESEKKINVNISSLASKDKDFGAAETMMSLLSASRFIEKNKNKSDLELFQDQTKALFQLLSDSKKDKKGFWWDLYVDRFGDLLKSGNLEIFSYYISQSSKKSNAADWLKGHEAELEKLNDWINK